METQPLQIRLMTSGLVIGGTTFTHGALPGDLASTLGVSARVVSLPRGRDPKARRWHVFDEHGIHALEDHRSDRILAITFVLVPEDAVVRQAIPRAAFKGSIWIGDETISDRSTGIELLSQKAVPFEPVLGGYQASCTGGVFHVNTKRRRSPMGRRSGPKLISEIGVSFEPGSRSGDDAEAHSA